MSFQITQVRWAEAEPMLCAIRYPVFVEEQGFPADIEYDGRDPDCVHVMARLESEGTPVGTARMLPDGHIGRVSVVREYRGKGIGSALILALLEVAKEKGIPQVDLDSQMQAVAFYARLGFEPFGPVFQEAGRPHQNMVARIIR